MERALPIQGFGNVQKADWASHFIHEAGGKIVAISLILKGGAIYNNRGHRWCFTDVDAIQPRARIN